ncbi:MAG: formylglycine-generating enzyme family protein [Kiritimatiellae bacterium]|nr:formylglycine-generating enzyme family protein [Kiritimatiellia bacterium]
MKKLLFVAALAAGSAMAEPSVSSVAMSQSAAGGPVVVSYTLSDGPAVITFDVQTNGVSIGGEHLVRTLGDVNKLVSGTSCSFRFWPSEAWQRSFSDPAGLNARAVVTAWATNAPPPYMAVSLSVASSQPAFYPCAGQVPGGVAASVYKTDTLLMRRIPAAGVQWRMGSPSSEKGRTYNEYGPEREVPHYVTLTNDYYIGVYELTQAQYHRFAYDASYPNPSSFRDLDDSAMRPLENLSYAQMRGSFSGASIWPNDGHAVASYCPIYKLRTRTGGIMFDLPTDAQWEFACRAGSGAALHTGEELGAYEMQWANYDGYSDNLDKIGWYNKNSGNETHEVGLKEPNSFGLYDMSGNVGEFCLDAWRTANSSDGWPYALETVEPIGPATANYNSTRVCRGGSYAFVCQYSRSAWRISSEFNTPDTRVGFRLVCPAIAIR